MFKSKVKLNDIAIAAPCQASWENMVGDDRQRACSLCALTVYNTSAMTKGEVEQLFANTDGKRVCLKIYRRTDGTLLTKDCPIGIRIVDKLRRKARIAVAALCGIFNFLPAFAQSAQPNSLDEQAATPELSDSVKLRPNDRLSGKVSCSAEEADARQTDLTGASQSAAPKAFQGALFIDIGGGQRLKIGGGGIEKVNVPITPKRTGPLAGMGVPIGGPLPVNLPSSSTPGSLLSDPHAATVDTRALACFQGAMDFEKAGSFDLAVQSYASALEVIRSEPEKYDPKFARTIASKYVLLLRRMKDGSRAREIEEEFLHSQKYYGSEDLRFLLRLSECRSFSTAVPSAILTESWPSWRSVE